MIRIKEESHYDKSNYSDHLPIRFEMKEVEFEGKRWHLAPLTREIETRKGTVNASGAYRGAQYWEYDGIKLIDII